MADTGWVFPGTCANEAADELTGAGNWTNPDNVKADNGSLATWRNTTEGFSIGLKCTNFDFSAIPAGSIIDGIEVRVGDYVETAAGGLVSGSTLLINELDVQIEWGNPGTLPASATTTPQTDEFGSTTDTWEALWTVEQVKDADFGALIIAAHPTGGEGIDIDFVQMRITYHAAAAGEIPGTGLPGHNPPHLSSGGNYYQIVDSGVGVVALKSSDPGGAGTWTKAADTGTARASNLLITSVQVSDVIHVVYAEDGGLNNDYIYASFNMATDAWLVEDETISAITAEIEQPWASIAIRSDGDVIVVYPGDPDRVMGGEKQRVDYARRESGTWTADQALDAAGDIHYGQPVCAMGTNDTCHILWSKTENATDPPAHWGDSGVGTDRFQGRSLGSTNSLSTTQTYSPGNQQDALLPMSNVVVTDRGGTVDINAPYGIIRSGVNTIYTVDADEDASDDLANLGWSTVTGNDHYVNGELCVTTLATHEDDLYILFSGGGTDGVDQDIYRSQSIADGAWITPVEHVNGVTCNYISAEITTPGSAIVLSYVYDDGGTLKYNEYVIDAGAALAAGTITITGDLAEAGGQHRASGTSTFSATAVAFGVHLASGTSTSLGDLAAIGSAIVPAITAAGTSIITGDLIAVGTHLTQGTSTITGELAGVGQSFVFAAGTITVSGDSVSRGTSLARGTITVLGDTVSYATKLGAATTSYIGQLIAGGGQHSAAGTSTTIGDLIAVGTFVGGTKNAAGTISVAGTLVSDGKQLASGTSAFSANVAASGTQTASGTTSLAGSLVAVGTINATGTITAVGDLATFGISLASGTSTATGDLAATSGRLFAFGISTVIGDLGAIGIDLSDTTKFAAGTSTIVGTLVTGGGQHRATGTISLSNTITANSRTNGTGTATITGDLVVGGGQQSAIGTALFTGDLVATGVDLSSGVVNAAGTILVGGGTGADGTWTQQASVAFTAGTGSPSFTHGLSTQEGDLVCVYVHINAVETIVAEDAGWIEEQNIQPDAVETCQTAIFWRRCTDSEPSTYSFQDGYNENWHVMLHHFRPTSAKYVPVVDLAASAVYQAAGSASLPCDAGNGETISAGGVSLKFGGKDNRLTATPYSTATNSYTGIIGRANNQNTGSAYRIFSTSDTIPTTLIGGSGQNDSPFSSHIAFVAQGAVGQLTAKGTSLAAGTSTSTGDLVAIAYTRASGTSTITGDLVSVGTHLGRGTITALGDAVGYATKLASGTVSVSGDLAAIGTVLEITAAGTSTITGDLAAIGTSVVAVTTAAGTITFSGEISKHLPSIDYGSEILVIEATSTNLTGTANLSFGGWAFPIEPAGHGNVRVVLATRDDDGDTYYLDQTHDPDGGTFGHWYTQEVDYVSGDFFDSGATGYTTTDQDFLQCQSAGNGGRWNASAGQVLYRRIVFSIQFSKSQSDTEGLCPTQPDSVHYRRTFDIRWSVNGGQPPVTPTATINVAGDLTALGGALAILANGTCNISGDLAANGTGIVLSTATININGRALGIGHQRGLCNLRSATIKISGSLTAFEDPSDNVAPITASIGVHAALTADLTHSADGGNLLAHASINVSAYLDQAYLHKVSCINPTATFFVNGGIQSAGLTDPNLFLPTATINFSFQLSTGSIYLRDLPIIYFAELAARGRVLADGVAVFNAQPSVFSTYGQIGPGIINGRKTAVINEPFGSITLYNNSQGAFYSTTGGQPLREARTTMIWSPTMSAKGVKDQTKFAIGNFIAAGRLISYAPAPPAVGTITANGSLSTSGDLTKFAMGTSTMSATLAAIGIENSPEVNLSNTACEDEAWGGDVAEAFYRLAADGYAYKWGRIVDGYIRLTADYVVPKSSAGSNVHVRMTYQSGSTVNGPTGWVDTTVDRVWLLSKATLGTRSASYLAEVSLDGGTTVEDSAVITFWARLNSGPPP